MLYTTKQFRKHGLPLLLLHVYKEKKRKAENICWEQTIWALLIEKKCDAPLILSPQMHKSENVGLKTRI